MNMVLEIWKPVVGFDDYEVSNLGQVRSHKRGATHLLKPIKQRSGHLQLWLRRDGKTVAVGVHRLVLEAFVGPCPEGLVGTHNDDNPANNCLTNLLWDTQSNNIRHMFEVGRQTQKPPKPRYGTEHPRHKLTEEQVKSIRNDNRSCAAIAEEYGVSPMTISRCRTRKTYTNV